MGNGKIQKQIEKAQDQLHKERLEKCVPLAKKLIKEIANADLAIGDAHAHDNDAYEAVAKEILKIFLYEDFKYRDKEFIFQLVLQPFDQIREIVVKSLAQSFDRAINVALKKDFMEVTVMDLDNLLKESLN